MATLTPMQTVITILAIAAATMITRFLPFILFPENRTAPKYIQYLGKVLPAAVIGLLVIYCFQDVSFLAYPYGIPELISVACIAGLHLWIGNTLLSIGGGTAIYMVLVQLVFVG